MRRSAVFSLPLFAALAAATAMGGCARTYGTGQAPEMALFNEMTGGFMRTEKKAPIQYQPRAPLVAPPAAGQLPPPVEVAEAANANWPVDPDQAVESRAYGREAADDPQAEYRRLRPLADVMPEQTLPREDWDRVNPQYDIVHSKQQRQQFEKELAESKGYGRTTERKFLTDPPIAYRAPAETAPMEEVKGSGSGGFLKWIFNRNG
jgi:hypothetical protein